MTTEQQKTVNSELEVVREAIAAARRSVEADAGASPVLAAVVREFDAKADKAQSLAGSNRRWEAIVELEQAADSAKAAVEADEGVDPSTADAVRDAHLKICILKSEAPRTLA